MSDQGGQPDPMLAALSAAQSAEPPAVPSEADATDPMLAALSAAKAAPAEQSQDTETPAATISRPVSRYRQATQPPPKSAPQQPLSWQQAGQQAVQNLIPSAGEAVGSLISAVAHPMQALGAVGQLGQGLLSQGEDLAGIHQDPQTRNRAQALVRAVESHYATTYGSPEGFKQAVATDPASILIDASTFLDGAGAVADAAKLGTVARVLHAASPLGIVGRGVGAVARGVTAPARAVLSTTSGVPPEAMRIAAVAGAEPNPALRQAFWNAANGNADPADYLQRAQRAIQAVRNDQSQAYLAGRANLSTDPVDFSNTYNALNEADQYLGKGAASGFGDAKDAVSTLRGMVDDVAGRNDPAGRNIDQADVLKRQIYDQRDNFSNAEARNWIDRVYHGVKTDINNVDPAYGALMEQYQTGMSNATNLQKTFIGAQNAPAASAALLKGMRAIRTGTNTSLLDQLAAKDPAIMYTIGGSAISPWMRGGLTGLLENMFSIGGLGGFLHQPLGAVAGVAAQSPRLAGLLNYGAGALGRTGANLAPYAAGAYYAGRAQDLQNPTQPANTASAPVNSNLAGMTYAAKVAQAEGMNNPSQRNLAGGNALGLGQFEPQTWLNLIRKHRPDLAGLPESQLLAMRTDPQLSMQMIDAYGQDNGQHLASAGIPVNDATKYGSAWFGPAGFEHVYRADPSTPMTELAPQLGLSAGDIKRNRFGDKTVGDIRAYIERHMGVPIESATGGRITAATGGKIEEGKSVEQLLDELMARSERVKRAQKEATKPLLKVPDNTVAAALKLVRQAI